MAIFDDLLYMIEMTRREYKSKNITPLTKEVNMLTKRRKELFEKLDNIHAEITKMLNDNFADNFKLTTSKKMFMDINKYFKDVYKDYVSLLKSDQTNMKKMTKNRMNKFISRIDKLIEFYNMKIKDYYGKADYENIEIKDMKNDIVVLRQLKSTYLKFVDTYEKFEKDYFKTFELISKIRETKSNLKKQDKKNEYDSPAWNRVFSKSKNDDLDISNHSKTDIVNKFKNYKKRQKNIIEGQFRERKRVTDTTSKIRKSDASFNITMKKIKKAKMELEPLKKEFEKCETMIDNYHKKIYKGPIHDYEDRYEDLRRKIMNKENEIEELERRYEYQKNK